MSKNLKAILSGAVALILSAACIFCPAIIAGSPSAASASTGSSNAADNSTLASEYDISVSKRDASGEYDAQEAVTLLPDSPRRIYLAATGSMALFNAISGLDRIRLSSLRAQDWYVESARQAMEAELSRTTLSRLVTELKERTGIE